MEKELEEVVKPEHNENMEDISYMWIWVVLFHVRLSACSKKLSTGGRNLTKKIVVLLR